MCIEASGGIEMHHVLFVACFQDCGGSVAFGVARLFAFLSQKGV